MANQYLKPQIPLKDLNSEDYFYPLTTHDQIIIGDSRLSAFFDKTTDKLSIVGNIDATIKLTGDTVGTSSSVLGTWTISTTTSKLSGLGRRTTATAIKLNPSVDTGFKISWHISDSSSRTNDAANSPSFDCTIINLPWDWGGYNGQIALRNTASPPRMQIRAAGNVDNGEGANPRYSPSYGDWREVVTAPKATQVGNATVPVYINNQGQAVAVSAGVNTGTANKIAFYSSAGGISSASRVELLDNYLISSNRNSTAVDVRINGLLIYGQTYGNDAAPMLSNTAGVFRFGDGGPQIIFNTSNSNRGLNAQAGALIFTDHDAAATGASFHFVTTESNNNNGGNLTVTAPRFRARAGLTIGQNSDNTEWNLFVNGTTCFKNQVYINFDQDVAPTTKNGSLIIGNKDGENVSIDGNEIMSRNNGAISSLYLNSEGGAVNSQWIRLVNDSSNTSDDALLYVRNYSNNDWSIKIAKSTYNYGLYIEGTGTKLLQIGTNGRLIVNEGSITIGNILYCKYAKDFIHNTNECNIIPDGYNNTMWFNYDTVTRKNNGNLTEYIMGNGKRGYANLRANKVYNAVWNDFAEYREGDITEPGRVVAVTQQSNKVTKTTIRLQPCAHIISDTFGCSVGQSDTAKTPVGVAGRVLVYPYQDISNYKIGDCLCAAPNGTADIMSREEIIYYPDRIIGIVDEIPTYEYWNQTLTTNKEGDAESKMQTEIKVNGRIWVYVR